MALQDKLIDALGRFATTFNSYRYIMAIKSAFITLMPVIIVGAFSVLISNMVLDPKNGLASFSSLSFLAALKPITSPMTPSPKNPTSRNAPYTTPITRAASTGNAR